MAEEQGQEQEVTQEFLDQHQYTMNGILRYEKIFGNEFVSTGGLRTTAELCRTLPLAPGVRVLDVGMGTGGSAFYMARSFGCHVTGVDLSKNMVDIAEQRRRQLPPELQQLLQFQIADCTTVEYPETFDIVYSRDTILHIADKLKLYQRCLSWLKPGGRLLVTDYCQADRELSEEFIRYRTQRGYKLLTVRQYGEVIRRAGFCDVTAREYDTYLHVLRDEVQLFKTTRQEFLKSFSQRDYDDIVAGWEDKIRRVAEGSQVWGLFTASKPLQGGTVPTDA